MCFFARNQYFSVISLLNFCYIAYNRSSQTNPLLLCRFYSFILLYFFSHPFRPTMFARFDSSISYKLVLRIYMFRQYSIGYSFAGSDKFLFPPICRSFWMPRAKKKLKNSISQSNQFMTHIFWLVCFLCEMSLSCQIQL